MNGNPVHVPNNDEIQKCQIFYAQKYWKVLLSKGHVYEVNNFKMKMKNDPQSCECSLCNYCILRSLKKSRTSTCVRIRTHDLMIPVQRSNQLSYEATDVGSWSIMCSCSHERDEL